MSELTLTVLRLGLLALLWFFVISVVGVLRGDLYGTRLTSRASRKERGGGRAWRSAAPAPAAAGNGNGAGGVGGSGAAAAAGAGGAGAAGGSTGNTPSQGMRRLGRGNRNAPTKLVVTEGSLRGTSLNLRPGTQVLIGRNPECTLILEDDFASGRHARIVYDDGQWTIEDLGSTNGTYLDDFRLTAPAPLEPGAHLRIGRTVLEPRK